MKHTENLPRNPLFIPDIETLVDIPPTKINALMLPSESDYSDGTLSAVGFNQITQLSSVNSNV